MRRLQGLKWRVVGATGGLLAPLGAAAPAFAAGGGTGLSITPNSSGLPGISAAEKLVGGLLTFGLIAAVAGLGLSAITWAIGNHSSNPQVASRGKTGTLVGALAGILVGGAMTFVNFAYNIGTGL